MQRFTIEVHTEGNTDVINLSAELNKRMAEMRGSGLVHLFVAGSTAALTTLEFEPGLIRHDLKAALERIAPEGGHYEHEATWNDDNGHSHVRAALIGPEISIPFANGKLMTGEYQQVVLIDFDTSPRRRTVVATVLT